MMAEVGRILFGLGIALSSGLTAIHLLRITPRIFQALPVGPAASLYEGVADRCHRLALFLSIAAAFGVWIDDVRGAGFIARLAAVAALAILHLIGRRLLPVERRLREHIASLGAGPQADAKIQRFDRIHRLYVALEALAIAIGFVFLTAAVQMR